jgi:hypothetical protein
VQKGSVSFGIFEQRFSWQHDKEKNQMTLTVRRAKVLFIQRVRNPSGN